MDNKTRDFDVSKFYVYNGPGYYLDTKALVFNIFLDPDGPEVDHYWETVINELPGVAEKKPSTVIDLFADTLIEVLKMDIDLFINNYSIKEDGEDYVVAVEFLDDYIAEDSVYVVSKWFKAMNEKAPYDFKVKYQKLQAAFDKSLLGGPTIYSLVEAGLKRNIPVFFLKEENQFQWGYGCKQLRGRSTTFHTDGIKDTEFTMFKDMCGEFLEMCGFPTPKGRNCFSPEEAVSEAIKLGFPVVVKPVAGHKGQGVTIGIETEEGVMAAWQKIINAVENEGAKFDGIIVQQQIYGTDHRLLTVGGKFAAALQRVPAYVDGNGTDNIEKLIITENDKEVRLDNARSPLCKIKMDDDLKEYLALQQLSLQSVPKQDERIFLRRVANISAGGVSINVSDKIHPKNIEMCEAIARYFKVKCLGIDVLAGDISKPWTDGNFGIIEINAGPGVFMHLAPAQGGSIDVPGKIMASHFYKPEFSRIPIIAGNNLKLSFASLFYTKLKQLEPTVFFGALVDEGVFFNGNYFYKNEAHDQSVKIILRNPEVSFALINHSKDDIYDYGFFHQGADIVILENPNYAEESLKEQLLSGGLLVEIIGNEFKATMYDQTILEKTISDGENTESLIMEVIIPHIQDVINKYE
jgi:cyanophycin synthetase